MPHVYIIQNHATKQMYCGMVGKIGKTPQERFTEHCAGNGGKYLYQSMQEHGVENFSIIWSSEHPDIRVIRQLEEDLIRGLNTLYPKGLNGNRGKYIIASPEARRRGIEKYKRKLKAGIFRINYNFKQGHAFYRYNDGTVRQLENTHPDISLGLVKHVNYDYAAHLRLEIQNTKIAIQRLRNNGYTDKQVNFFNSPQLKNVHKTNGWKHGRAKFKQRMNAKQFTPAEIQAYTGRSKQTQSQWDKITDISLRSRITSPGQQAMNAKYQCKICGTMSNKGNITRWHNDNCKQKVKNESN